MLGHFGDVHPSQSRGTVLKKLNPTQHKQTTPGTEPVQALTDISHSVLCCHSNKTVHRLQIHTIVHNKRAPSTIPPTYIRVRAVVWECGEGQTHRQP